MKKRVSLVSCSTLLMLSAMTVLGQSKVSDEPKAWPHGPYDKLTSPAPEPIVVLTNGTQAQKADTPTNPVLRQELLNRVKNDQAIREELIKKGIQQPDAMVLARMRAIDSDNTARLKTIVQQDGWPAPELVGKDGTEAAFLLVQHADHVDPAFQKEMLPLVREAYRAHKLSGEYYALLLDRVRVGEGKPQVYGTQAKPIEQWKGKEPVLEPIEDEANVDKRRAEVGLQPLAEYVKVLKQVYFPNDKDN